MKKIRLLCVGRIKENYLDAGIKDYLKRLSRFCEVTVDELEPPSGTSVKKESDAILAALQDRRTFVILCDMGGREITSTEFSATLDRAFLSAPEVTYIVGGSEGVDDRVRARADAMVSFGKVTYPHRLMRLILVEQIYRAFNIKAGTPYHK